jgi:hypothetical protein
MKEGKKERTWRTRAPSKPTMWNDPTLHRKEGRMEGRKVKKEGRKES